MNQLITLIFMLLWSLTVGDEPASCLFSEVCVLPCQSNYHDIIHWQKIDSGTRHVHSFYNGADQLAHQDEAYKGRTSLFTDQITEGNMSLILRGVKTQDRGKYKCYTANSSNNKEAFVTLKVKAPIKSVDIKVTDEGVTCQTSEVYPKPNIVWYVDGKEKANFEPKLKEDTQGLFSLISTLPALPVQNDVKYSCSITTEGETQIYTASLKQGTSDIKSGQDITIPCPHSDGETGNSMLILTFNNLTILRYDRYISPPVNKKWNGADVEVTPEGNIVLHSLDSEKHAGTYTCERVSHQSRQSMQTSVHIAHAGLIVGIAVAIGIIVVIAAIVAITVYIYRKKCSTQSDNENQRSDGHI